MSELSLTQGYVLWNVMGFAFLGLHASLKYMPRNARRWLFVGLTSALSAGASFAILIVPRMPLGDLWFAGAILAFFAFSAYRIWQRYRKTIARGSG
jgi:hypothetical protein